MGAEPRKCFCQPKSVEACFFPHTEKPDRNGKVGMNVVAVGKIDEGEKIRDVNC